MSRKIKSFFKSNPKKIGTRFEDPKIPFLGFEKLDPKKLKEKKLKKTKKFIKPKTTGRSILPKLKEELNYKELQEFKRKKKQIIDRENKKLSRKKKSKSKSSSRSKSKPISKLEIVGLPKKAMKINGTYILTDSKRNGHYVWRQQLNKDRMTKKMMESIRKGDLLNIPLYELSHNGKVWVFTSVNHRDHIWAYVISNSRKPYNIPKDKWEVYDGENWIKVPSRFSIKSLS